MKRLDDDPEAGALNNSYWTDLTGAFTSFCGSGDGVAGFLPLCF